MKSDLREKIADADYVLIGIGEEFEIKRSDIESNENYSFLLNHWKDHEQIFPYIEKDFIENSNDQSVLLRKQAYDNLFQIVKQKDYFIVSLCMDGIIGKGRADEERIVEPCGTLRKLQCSDKCTADLYEPDLQMMEKIKEFPTDRKEDVGKILPLCPKCGRPLVFNNILTENYMEEGYLDKWQKYTKWLQRTINRKLCILELGVGMRFPTVIRWPFEKVAYFNQKASFFRVHSKLYQVAEEITERSTGVKADPIDFLFTYES